ncbi:CHC2 zinc finger domain-containing protein [Mucilaginibacter sp.]|uniref:CHC2 zinc finger domain-containing protein n=1 Tax=Mucilaginibacter sp. TaxID=1882438 RepID=UPI002605D5A5|nr:CHC2 zinc finger domain-containing protein [Mucilaginibacter sp.]MDB4918045.1 primase [Mucilaginibacter sp.]
MIPKAFIDTVLQETDIAELIGRYIDLIERGQGLAGECPFDGGSKPSFTVSPDKQIWKCFNCNKGGNAIKFVIEIEKLSFPDAVRFLAKRLDLEVPEEV